MFAVITDNASSMRKAVQNMIRNSLCAVHNNCFAHTLQLCVEDGLKSQPEITAVIEKFRAIVSVFHHSTVLTESLKKAQETLGIPEKKLVADVRTRWNSTCIMLRSAVALLQLIGLALFNSKSKKSPPSEAYCDLARRLIGVLESFEEATTIASGEEYATVSIVHPLVRHLIYTTTSTTEQLAPSPAATAMEDMSTGDLQLTVENFS